VRKEAEDKAVSAAEKAAGRALTEEERRSAALNSVGVVAELNDRKAAIQAEKDRLKFNIVGGGGPKPTGGGGGGAAGSSAGGGGGGGALTRPSKSLTGGGSLKFKSRSAADDDDDARAARDQRRGAAGKSVADLKAYSKQYVRTTQDTTHTAHAARRSAHQLTASPPHSHSFAVCLLRPLLLRVCRFRGAGLWQATSRRTASTNEKS
jgi:hypothetical protein